MRQPDRRLHHLAQSLHRGKIAIAKRMGLAGKEFEHAQDFVVIYHGHHNDGGNAELAAYIVIDAGIPLGVVASQGLPGSHTFAGKAELR